MKFSTKSILFLTKEKRRTRFSLVKNKIQNIAYNLPLLVTRNCNLIKVSIANLWKLFLILEHMLLQVMQ